MPSTSPFLSLCSPVRNFSFLSSIHGEGRRRQDQPNRSRIRSHQRFPSFFLSFFLPFFSSVIVAFDSPLGLDRSNYHPWTRFMLVLSPSPPSLSLSLSFWMRFNRERKVEQTSPLTLFTPFNSNEKFQQIKFRRKSLANFSPAIHSRLRIVRCDICTNENTILSLGIL